MARWLINRKRPSYRPLAFCSPYRPTQWIDDLDAAEIFVRFAPLSVIQERSRDARKPPLAIAARSEPAFRYSKAVGFLLRFAMPTILRIGGRRVTIFPNDHGPPHVHVIGAKGEAVFLLNCPGGPAELRESYGFNGTEIRQVASDLRAHIPALCNGWKSIHGHL